MTQKLHVTDTFGMRSSILSILLLSACLLHADPVTNITLAWDLPAEALSTNASVQVYSSTNLTVPLKSWTLLTNAPAITNAVRLEVKPGLAFYAVTYSNLWGVSDFSAVTATPPLVRGDQINLGVSK